MTRLMIVISFSLVRGDVFGRALAVGWLRPTFADRLLCSLQFQIRRDFIFKLQLIQLRLTLFPLS